MVHSVASTIETLQATQGILEGLQDKELEIFGNMSMKTVLELTSGEIARD